MTKTRNKRKETAAKSKKPAKINKGLIKGAQGANDYFRMLQVRGSRLLHNIKKDMPELEELLVKADAHWGLEDSFYRYYHHSFKVYRIQDDTQKIVEALRGLSPWGEWNWPSSGFLNKPDVSELLDRPRLHSLFEEIIKDGASGVQFKLAHNVVWSKKCRLFLEAFFHARQFLHLAVKYGKELKKAPELLPSGWAALLTLYGIR